MSEYISYFPTLTATTPEEISWETVTTTIRGDFLRQKTEQYRRALADGDKAQMKAIQTSCPAIVCQAVLEGGRSQDHIRKYTGEFMADFDHVPKEKLAEAMKLINTGERYWLDDKQIKELNERNKAYMTPDPAKEMIVTYFTIPHTESETKYMTASKIAARFMPLIKISPTKIGIAMAELGYEQVRSKKGRFWKVAERPGNEIVSRLPGDETEPMPF